MKTTTILLVDDEAEILTTLSANLRNRGYEVSTALDGGQATAILKTSDVDLVVLDLGLPDVDGVNLLSDWRTWNDVPVIVVSARVDETDKIVALDVGADDYLTKPFAIGEVLARIRAALRRAGSAPHANVVTTEDFSVDFERGVITKDGRPVRLTPIEWKMIAALIHAQGRLVTQQQLLREVWGEGFDSETNYLRVHMTHIRKKLEAEPGRPRYFRTEPGIGYRFVNE